jgi:LacI family transcriptional regulator
VATLHDVALSAGVSKTTVSRYLNKSIELPAGTIARIDAAIAKLEYRPNLMARHLSTGRTEAIGLVVPEIREPFFAELASAVEDEADRHGYTIFISSTRSDRAREIASLNRLRDHHVDGLILLTNTPDDGSLARLIGKRRNVVLLDEDIPDVSVPKVFVENEAGAYRATRHLIDKGHRVIGYLGGPLGLLSSEERYAGFQRAMVEAGLTPAGDHVRRGSFSPDFARLAVLDILRSKTPPTAIFASSDYLALGAIAGLRQAGVDVPRSTEQQRRRSKPIRRAELRRGDLVFFDEQGKKSSHVGLYVGGGEFVHAPSSGKPVRKDRLDAPYWRKHLSEIRRVA